MVQPKYISNENGPELGYVTAGIIEKDGLFFKDLEGVGELLPYEDWRLAPEERAKDLASRLTIQEIAGLMLYSSHQAIPASIHKPELPAPTYGGKPYAESGAAPSDLTDQQRKFLEEDYVRHVLVYDVLSPEIAAAWSNEAQAFAESKPHGIPINVSSDPRHGASKAETEFKTSGKDISKWPEGLAMAATFDPKITRRFGEVASMEYRAMGIGTALSPQVDMATEPRWFRGFDTFGCDPDLVTDMSRAYCDSMQTSVLTDGSTGWGKESVVAMAKHWPGGGTGEGGRDAHFPFGEFAVYPGNNGAAHLKPFVEGAFALEGGTKCAGAVMPYYTVSWNYDIKDGKNVGNSYSHYIINDLLREKYGFEGVICTDWVITSDPLPKINSFSPRCYGVSDLTEAERHLLLIENGVDQFGGNDSAGPVIEAYEIGVKRHGEAAMRARMERSAVRLLTGIFRLGLFENPYLDPKAAQELVGCEAFCKEGYDAQVKSVVMLKNNGVLPIAAETGRRLKVYIPDRHIDETTNFMRTTVPPQDMPGTDKAIAGKYYDPVDTPEEADFAMVFMASPISDPFSDEDLAAGGNGYLPISLQYEPYTAEYAREVSIAGGDPREDFTNRSYKGKSNRTANYQDLVNLREARKAMGDKPVIAVIAMKNPCILAEVEPLADAILVDFGVQQQVLFEVVSGKEEPSGLLPVQLPADMKTVEEHCEDVPHDMTPYTDTQGNTYDFAFGLNFSGRIKDERTEKYGK